MILKFHQYITEDKLDTPETIIKFSEYRKGSSVYGKLVEAIMMWLRTYRKDKYDILTTSLNRFLSETKISLEELNKFILEYPKLKLISFGIKIEGPKIIFLDLNNTTKNRYVWEEKII